MVTRCREWLALLLLGVLPFHAFLVTFGTKVLVGQGYAPLPMLALWKEGVLLLLLLLAAVEILQDGGAQVRDALRTDVLDQLILGLLVLAVVVTAATHGDTRLFAYGFKYDYVPLVAFLVLRRVPWSHKVYTLVYTLLLAVGGVVAVLGLLSLFLPMNVFVVLGYSDLHSLYLSNGPLAAFQQIGSSGLRRIQSTLSGPNQLGLWLLIPWSFAVVSLLKRRDTALWLLLFGLATAITFTFSRSAWIAAVLVAFVALFTELPRASFRRAAALVGFVAVIVVLALALKAPSLLLRAASTRDHLLRPLEAIHTIVAHPLGLGLGTAGPASNRVSDTCVHLESGADASWAVDRPDLCVFVADVQVQPEVPCTCPVLPENWYLQIGVELGVLGFMLFLALTVLVLRRLAVTSGADSPKHTPVFLAFLGIAVASLFLHAWESAAVAYSVWILTAVALPAPRLRAS